MLALLSCASPAQHYHPTCTAEFGPPTVCVHGKRVIHNCTRAADTTRPSKTGAWVLDDTQPYLIDRGLVRGLVKFFREDSVTEFGAGKGCYTDALRTAGVRARGFEGAEGVTNLTGGFIQQADLTGVLALGRRDWVLCLEVAEHVPKVHEAAMLANLDRHNRKGIVMSWSSMRSGNGHINPQPASHVRQAMERLNYTEDVDAGKALRAAVTTWSWFRTTAKHGKAGGGVRVWLRKYPPIAREP